MVVRDITVRKAVGKGQHVTYLFWVNSFSEGSEFLFMSDSGENLSQENAKLTEGCFFGLSQLGLLRLGQSLGFLRCSQWDNFKSLGSCGERCEDRKMGSSLD